MKIIQDIKMYFNKENLWKIAKVKLKKNPKGNKNLNKLKN